MGKRGPKPRLTPEERHQNQLAASRKCCKAWRLKYPEKVKESHSKWRKKNMGHLRQYARGRYHANIEDGRARNRASYQRHKSRVFAREKERIRRDPAFRMMKCLRTRSATLLRGPDRKRKRASKPLGCTSADFKIYIESLFEPGMRWDNYGRGDSKWHVDHIMPCAIFDLSKPDHQKRCFHFSNLRPMWGLSNLQKHDNVTDPQFVLPI